MGQIGWLIDLGKCIGCESCTVACKSEWHTAQLESPLEFKEGCEGDLAAAPDFTGCLASPKQLSYRRVVFQAGGAYPNPSLRFITSACNHCDKPACMAACPLSNEKDPANPRNVITKRASDGVVLVNQETCIGCKYCLWACPYGAPQFNEATRKVEKCTFCVHRVDDGLQPACVTTCIGRAGVYRALATLYLQPPTAQLVGGLLSLSNQSEMAELLDGPAAACLRRYASGFGGDIRDLQQEFQDLFVVPLGRYVTPYEAVYRDERTVGEARVRGLLMGPSTVAVIAAYRDGGARVPSDCAELPDHIGVELDFMAFLCARERETWQEGDVARAQEMLGREREFLDMHLLQWAPALARRIGANAASDFYRGIGLLTEEFIRADATTLARACGERDRLTPARQDGAPNRGSIG